MKLFLLVALSSLSSLLQPAAGAHITPSDSEIEQFELTNATPPTTWNIKPGEELGLNTISIGYNQAVRSKYDSFSITIDREHCTTPNGINDVASLLTTSTGTFAATAAGTLDVTFKNQNALGANFPIITPGTFFCFTAHLKVGTTGTTIETHQKTWSWVVTANAQGTKSSEAKTVSDGVLQVWNNGDDAASAAGEVTRAVESITITSVAPDTIYFNQNVIVVVAGTPPTGYDPWYFKITRIQLFDVIDPTIEYTSIPEYFPNNGFHRGMTRASFKMPWAAYLAAIQNTPDITIVATVDWNMYDPNRRLRRLDQSSNNEEPTEGTVEVSGTYALAPLDTAGGGLTLTLVPAMGMAAAGAAALLL